MRDRLTKKWSIPMSQKPMQGPVLRKAGGPGQAKPGLGAGPVLKKAAGPGQPNQGAGVGLGQIDQEVPPMNQEQMQGLVLRKAGGPGQAKPGLGAGPILKEAVGPRQPNQGEEQELEEQEQEEEQGQEQKASGFNKLQREQSTLTQDPRSQEQMQGPVLTKAGGPGQAKPGLGAGPVLKKAAGPGQANQGAGVGLEQTDQEVPPRDPVQRNKTYSEALCGAKDKRGHHMVTRS